MILNNYKWGETKMKKKITIFAFIIMLLGNFTLTQANSNKTKNNNQYFGQETPNNLPIQFTTNYIHTDLNCSPSFSPDGKEVFWKTKEHNGLFMSKLVGDNWTEPVEIKFCSDLVDYRAAFYSPDGNRLFFLAKGKCSEHNNSKLNLYYVNRIENGWSQPIALCEEINCNFIDWQISIANNGNLYFAIKDPDFGIYDIYYSKFINGKYELPEKLPSEINTGMFETTPYVSPDESYLIFSRFNIEKDDYADLYISFRNEDGSWSKAVNMGENINKEYNNLSPQVTSDGKYLFYLQTINGKTSPVWVSSDVIKEIKNKVQKKVLSNN
jgi:hypothetical protein